VSFRVSSSDFWTYAVAEGIAGPSRVAGDPDDATVEELIDLYRVVQGEHPGCPHARRTRLRPYLARTSSHVRPKPDPAHWQARRMRHDRMLTRTRQFLA